MTMHRKSLESDQHGC